MKRGILTALACLSLVAFGSPTAARGAAGEKSPRVEPPADDGAPHTYVQKFNDRGERYSSESEAAADMDIVTERIKSAGYVILHRFVAADVDDPNHQSPWNNYRFEITYIAPHRARIDGSKIQTLRQLKAEPDDCQVINPEFCR